jgi:hypothetical protein
VLLEDPEQIVKTAVEIANDVYGFVDSQHNGLLLEVRDGELAKGDKIVEFEARERDCPADICDDQGGRAEQGREFGKEEIEKGSRLGSHGAVQ